MVIRNLDRTETEPMDSPDVQGVRMAVMAGREDGAPNFAIRQIVVEPSGHTPLHSHDYEHEIVVLEGRGTATLEGEVREIAPGDVLFIPPEREHQFRASSDASLRFLCVTPVNAACGAPVPGT